MTMRMPSLMAQGSETGLYMVVDVSETEDEVILKLTICELADAPPTGPNLVEMTPMDICEGENILSQPTLTAYHGDEVSFQMSDASGETFSLTALPKKL